MISLKGIYLVTSGEGREEESFLTILEEALKGGLSLVQLREKKHFHPGIPGPGKTGKGTSGFPRSSSYHQRSGGYGPRPGSLGSTSRTIGHALRRGPEAAGAQGHHRDLRGKHVAAGGGRNLSGNLLSRYKRGISLLHENRHTVYLGTFGASGGSGTDESSPGSHRGVFPKKTPRKFSPPERI